MNVHMRRQQKRKRSRTTVQPELRIALLLVGTTALLFGMMFAVNYWNQTQRAQVSSAAGAAVGSPIQAVHEMGPGPRIPFLPQDGPQPSISLSEELYDFGQIGPTDIVEHTFTIQNNGEAPLTISRAYTTCGCTTAEISASVIPPGEFATAKLVFDAGFHDTAGQTVRRGIIIENNDPNASQTEFWVQADVQSN